MQYWTEHGPILRFREKLINEGIFTPEEIDRLQAQADMEIDEAVRYAKAQPYPSEAGLTGRVYR